MRSPGQQTANLGSSDGTFRPQPKVSIELPTLAVLMAPVNLSCCLVNKLHSVIFGYVVAEMCHYNCQGLQFIDQTSTMAEMCHQNCQGWQFTDQEIAWLKSAIRTAKVCSSMTVKKVPSELQPGGSSDGTPSKSAM